MPLVFLEEVIAELLLGDFYRPLQLRGSLCWTLFAQSQRDQRVDAITVQRHGLAG
jgi:hypothetical protein